MGRRTRAIRVVVTGGRWFKDKDAVWWFLDRINEEYGIDELVHGNQVGADTLCKEWAEHNQIVHRPFDPDWKRFGKAAGPLRNQQMLDETDPDMVVAFPGHRGTTDMMTRALEQGFDLLEFDYSLRPG